MLCRSFFNMSGNYDGEEKYLFDFRNTNDLDKWYESSDVVRTPGKSKASFVLQETKVKQ